MLSHSCSALARLAFVAVLAAPTVCTQAGNPEGAPRKAISKSLPDLHLLITLPTQLTDVTSGEKPDNQSGASWKGRLGGCDVEVALSVLPNTDLDFVEPEDVSDHVLEQFRSATEGADQSFAYEKSDLVNGSFGWAPYAALGWGPFRARDGAKTVGKYYTLGGLLEKHGYSLEVVARPFYAKVFETTVEEASESAGVASGDFYATTFEAAGDPVHIHEATHQIFDNRLRLSGGGSWFQEGVAEYMATKRNDRNDAARAVKTRKHTPLAEFIRIEDLLAEDPSSEDKKGEEKAATHYALAALLIEFLRESEWGKDKFQQWVHAIGCVPDNDSIAIERATQAVYHASVAELEKQWVEYCKKR